MKRVLASTVAVVRFHALLLIAVSAGLGLACRVVWLELVPGSVDIGNRAVLLTCDSVALFVPLAFAVALARPFGVAQRAPYPPLVQLLATVWTCWILLIVTGLASMSLHRVGVSTAVRAVLNLGGLLLVLGYPFGFWLSAGTVLVLVIEAGRRVRQRTES